MLFSAGSNPHGQLPNTSPDDSRVFTILLSNRKLLHLAFGANHMLALLQLAGNTSRSWDRHGLTGYLPRLVAASWETTYAVLSRQGMADVLVAMGANDFGDLGIGAKRAGRLPAKDVHVIRFDHLSQNGVAVDSASLVVESLAAGQHRVLATLKTTAGDLAVGWGTSRHGQIGNVEKPFLSSPALISLGQSNDAIIHAALGHQHTVFLLASWTISSLGSNRKCQLDGIDGAARARSVACTWNGTYITTGDEDAWELLSAGNNANGQLGRGHHEPLARVEFPFTPATRRLLQIACGSEHVLASFMVLDSSTVEVWGWGCGRRSSQAQGGNVGIWAGSGTSWIVF
ncbi:regulator of chromosome condensation 1/beta-lactamase-inhibitor protein II [Mycena leptocephala]|nr:regulator of chromosome condensation 1/beta-lactamase-inhibitor protein II [Mycena leptocephala]